MDDNHKLGDPGGGHQFLNAVPGLVVGQEGGVQLASQVLPLQDHVGLDDVPTGGTCGETEARTQMSSQSPSSSVTESPPQFPEVSSDSHDALPLV